MKKTYETPKGVPELIRELRMRAAKLDQLDDEISEQIRSLEEALRSLKLGVRLFTVIVGGDAVYEYTEILAFDKHGGQWRLLFEAGQDGDPETWSTTPLTDCARDIRAKVMERQYISTLLQEGLRQLDEAIENRICVLSKTDNVIAEINHVMTGIKGEGR